MLDDAVAMPHLDPPDDSLDPRARVHALQDELYDQLPRASERSLQRSTRAWEGFGA